MWERTHIKNSDLIYRFRTLKPWQAACLIALIGFAVFSIGLSSPFQGDDYDQIVNNVPVHSIGNIVQFFEGGTFYGGQSEAHLQGSYFRPLMTTTFSIIYTLFGAHSFYYHALQLVLYIGSAILLYLFFRYSFSVSISLGLALIFLVHPMDSQTVYAIPSMQDVLYFFFGMLGLYMIVRYKGNKHLLVAVASLITALLAKETAVLFIVLCALYLFWWDRKRIVPFLGMLVVPILIYIPLRIHAVGLLNNPEGGPIDRLSLLHRLYTAPSIFEFYITHLVWPWKIASGYYWTYQSFSFEHVLLPLVFDLIIIGLFIYLAFRLRNHATKAMFYTYMFFLVWCAIGFGLLMQIEPLDLTAADIWLYFPFAGLLGMIGAVFSAFPIKRFRPEWLYVAMIILICALGIRSFYRGYDYHSPYRLAMVDIRNSPDNYRADKIIAGDLIDQHQYVQAEPFETQAMLIFPQYGDFINMAAIMINEGRFDEAESMYRQSIPFAGSGSLHQSYEGMGVMTLFTSNQISGRQILLGALQKFPGDPLLWTYLAVLYEKNNDNTDAVAAIQMAARYGQVPSALYSSIMNDQQTTISIAGRNLFLQ